MLERIEGWRHRHERNAVIIGKSVIAVALITGCTWVPDELSPVEWYKGVAGAFSDDEPAPEIATPRRGEKNTSTSGGQAAKGLVADRENSQYAPAVKRDPTPTKQLAKRTPAPAQPDTQVAQSDTPAARTSAQTSQPETQAAPTLSLDRRMAQARDEGPAAPPKTAPGGPPARADVPDQIPVRRSILSDQFQRRLAESAAATNKSDPLASVPPARSEASYNQPVHTYAVPANAPVSYARPAYAADVAYGAPQLIPPKGMPSVRGAKGVRVPSAPAATFDVASLQFGADGGLTAADRAALRDVVRLQRQTGGTIRVAGQISSGAISFAGGDEDDIARQRAMLVAKALTGMGIPARKVLVASDPIAGGYDDGGAKVSIEY